MVIKMRVFYIYNVNDFFYEVYNKYPYKLYKMLEDTYYTNRYDMMMSNSYYEAITNNFNKLFINNFLSLNHSVDAYYNHKANNHLISNYHEYTKLTVNSYCLKLKTNINYPSFFETLRKFSNKLFICDFENQDYFWLENVRKKEELLVKE